MTFANPRLTWRRAAAGLAAVLAIALAGCGSKSENGTGEGAESAQSATTRVETYRADIHVLNPTLTAGNARGTAEVTVRGDTVTFDVKMAGVAPGMMHMQHLHGFVNGDGAVCAGAGQDSNDDGIVDDPEVESVSGGALIPLNEDPAALQVGSATYPRASADSTYHYHRSVSLKKLTGALEQQKEMAALHLDRLVINIHGVPEGTSLPETVKSPPDVKPQTTVPIACGELERVPG